MKFRKRPVVIEAFRWGHHEPPEWFSEAIRAGKVIIKFCDVVIETLEGPMLGCPGDWIIRGIKHELYPCKADIFDLTYESVE